MGCTFKYFTQQSESYCPHFIGGVNKGVMPLVCGGTVEVGIKRKWA